MTRLAIILAILAAQAHAVGYNPGQTDPTPAPAAAPAEPDMSDRGSDVRWNGTGYNLIPSHKCVSMHCDETQGGDR